MYFIPTKINIATLKINSPDQMSSLLLGSTMKVGVNVSGKKNQAFGQQLGDNSTTVIPIGITLDDNEIFDSHSTKLYNKKMVRSDLVDSITNGDQSFGFKSKYK